MGCQVIKCSNTNCTNKGKACTFINGKCPSCFAKEQSQITNPKP